MKSRSHMAALMAIALAAHAGLPDMSPTKAQKDRDARTPEDINDRRAKNAAKRERRARRNKP